MSLEGRIRRLEAQGCQGQLDVKVMTDDELAAIVTGNPEAKASDVTREELEKAAEDYIAVNPGCHIIRCLDQETKDLTLKVIAGEGT